MRGLLAGKEALKAFYARYSAFVNAFLRFITAFAAVFLINQNIGLMPKLSGGLVPLFAGIICAFLPFGAIAFLIGIFLLAQLFAASMEVALITLVFLLIVVLLYYGFQPGDSAYLIVTPILFFLKVPFAVPMILGLTGSLVSVIPMSCGIFLYYVILYVKQNGSFLAGSEQTEITQMLAQVIKNLQPDSLVFLHTGHQKPAGKPGDACHDCGMLPGGADGLCAQETVDQLLLGDRDRSWPYFTDSGCVYRRFPLWRSGVRAGAGCGNDWCGHCIADLSAVCFFGRLQPDRVHAV